MTVSWTDTIVLVFRLACQILPVHLIRDQTSLRRNPLPMKLTNYFR